MGGWKDVYGHACREPGALVPSFAVSPLGNCMLAVVALQCIVLVWGNLAFDLSTRTLTIHPVITPVAKFVHQVPSPLSTV